MRISYLLQKAQSELCLGIVGQPQASLHHPSNDTPFGGKRKECSGPVLQTRFWAIEIEGRVQSTADSSSPVSVRQAGYMEWGLGCTVTCCARGQGTATRVVYTTCYIRASTYLT